MLTDSNGDEWEAGVIVEHAGLHATLRIDARLEYFGAGDCCRDMTYFGQLKAGDVVWRRRGDGAISATIGKREGWP